MEPAPLPRRRGRGVAEDPPVRFERLHVAYDAAALDPDELRAVPTEVYRDDTRTVLSENRSPDVPFRYSLNPYRGCEHGCVYCYARPSHEYLGWSAGLDFERRILVKAAAPALLARELSAPGWVPEPITLSGNTDPYQPLERRLGLTRGCLEVLARHRNPVSVITKSALVARDADLLASLAGYGAARVWVTVTTLRDAVAATLEPRAARPGRRLETVARLVEAGVPVGVLVSPVIPGLTDEEVPAVVEAAAAHGADVAGTVLLRLPGPVEPLFVAWLRSAFPDRAEKVLGRLRSMRGGALSDARFGTRMRGEGAWADAISSLFRTACRRAGVARRAPPLSTAHFRRLAGGQMGLFDAEGGL